MKLIITFLLLLNSVVVAQVFLGKGIPGNLVVEKPLTTNFDDASSSLSYSYSYSYSPGPDLRLEQSLRTPSESPLDVPSESQIQFPNASPNHFHSRPEQFSDVCPLQSAFSDPLDQPHGTLRDASSTPAFVNVAFDPIVVGWTGQYSRGRVAEGLFPNMTAYISDDEGNTFNIVNSSSFIPGRLLTAARYKDAIIVGGEAFPNKNQIILTSNDGGSTFTESYTGGTGVIYGSCLTNSSFGYAVGTLDPTRHSNFNMTNHTNSSALQQGVILFTTDGGSSWQDIPVPNQNGVSVNLRGVSCPDDFTVVIVGRVNDTQTIWTSFDSAATFEVEFFGENLLYDVSVLPSGIGYAVGAESSRSLHSANILRTFDWGETWEEVFRGGGSLYGVLAFNVREAFTVGVNFAAKAQIFRSFSEGEFWQRYKPSIGFDVLYGVTAGFNSSHSDITLRGRVNEFAEPDRLLVSGNLGTSGDGRSPVLIDTCHFQNMNARRNFMNGTTGGHHFHHNTHSPAFSAATTDNLDIYDDDFSYGDDTQPNVLSTTTLEALHRRLEEEFVDEEDEEDHEEIERDLQANEVDEEELDEKGEFEDQSQHYDARSLRIRRGWNEEDINAAE